MLFLIRRTFLLVLFLVCLLAFYPGNEAQAQTGLLWSVVKPGSRDTSFLLGTLHKYPKTVVQVPQVVEEKLANCRTLYLEMQLDWKMVFKMLTSGTMNSEMMIDEDKEWTDEDWENIKHWFVEGQKMDEQDFNRIKGNASSSRLVDMYLKLYGFEYGEVETDLKFMAKRDKIPIKGLDKDWEEIQTWYAHYAQGSSGFWQEGNLDSLLADGYYSLADLFVSYAVQDTATLGEIDKEDRWENGLSLVEWRNINWMKQLPQLMGNRTFVAVGAAHLYGKNGVINLLKQEGFTCTPVEGHFGGDKLERFIRRNCRQYQLAD
jgi:uncharacterized protein YbaP (TraB family)